jgi:hypothetical protein
VPVGVGVAVLVGEGVACGVTVALIGEAVATGVTVAVVGSVTVAVGVVVALVVVIIIMGALVDAVGVAIIALVDVIVGVIVALSGSRRAIHRGMGVSRGLSSVVLPTAKRDQGKDEGQGYCSEQS